MSVTSVDPKAAEGTADDDGLVSGSRRKLTVACHPLFKRRILYNESNTDLFQPDERVLARQARKLWNIVSTRANDEL